MHASQNLGRLARPKIQPVVKLCLCKSYSVLTACIASSLQNQANPVFSKLTPATRTQDSGSTVSPGSSTRREHFSADTGLSQTPLSRLNESKSTQRFLL